VIHAERGEPEEQPAKPLAVVASQGPDFDLPAVAKHQFHED
jgi:hypothetical protein